MSFPERTDNPCSYCYAVVSGNYVFHAYWCVRGIEAEKVKREETRAMVERDVEQAAERRRRQRWENRRGKHRPERTGTQP